MINDDPTASSPPPPPMLAYAAPMRKPHGHDLGVARDVAARFASWNMIVGTLVAAAFTLVAHENGTIEPVDACTLFSAAFISTCISYVSVLLICWLHMRHGKFAMAAKRNIWHYTAVYSLPLEGMVLLSTVNGGSFFWTTVSLGWAVTVPWFASLLLLEKRDRIS